MIFSILTICKVKSQTSNPNVKIKKKLRYSPFKSLFHIHDFSPIHQIVIYDLTMKEEDQEKEKDVNLDAILESAELRADEEAPQTQANKVRRRPRHRQTRYVGAPDTGKQGT